VPSPQPDPGLDGPHAAELVALQQVVEAHEHARAVLTDQLVAQVRAIVQAFTGWYDDLAVRRMAKQIGDLVGATQRVMASQEDAYLARTATMLAGRTYRPVGQVSTTDLRAGAVPGEVYQRLAVQYRYERSIGTAEPAALTSVVDRADAMNQMDVALVARSEAEKFFTAHKITGYRRTVHPELSKSGTCGLCISASTRIYRTDRLMPIHNRCCCGVMPIIGGWDAGDALNGLDLKTLYTDAAGGSGRAGTDARDLKRTRYRVDQHGELGPVLVPHDAGRQRKRITTAGSQGYPRPAAS
jgi:hypothetical protein